MLRPRTGAATEDGELLEGSVKAVGAMLQLFDLCPPQEDSTIRRADLESVLRQHLGQSEAASGVGRILGGHDGSEGRLDFLSYWRCMDRLFAEAGAWPAPSASSGKADTLGSMRAFRDGALELWSRHAPAGAIPASELLDLLAQVQEGAEDPGFWGEVLRAAPHEGSRGLSLCELANAVSAWLRRQAGGGSAEQEPAPVTPRESTRRRSLSATARLGNGGSEASSSSTGHSSPWVERSRRRERQRRTSLLLDGVPTPAVDLQRAVEFVEFLGRSLDPGSHAQQAQHQLLVSLGSLSRALQRQEMDLSNLRGSNAVLGQKREALEAELAHMREFHEDLRELQEQRDEERQRAEAMELELLALKEQHLHCSEELERFRAGSAEHERQRADTERRDWQWRDRCSQLEQAADIAEGQSRWMREELERQRVELLHAREQRQAFEALGAEVTRLRRSLRAASDSLRSYAAYAAESDECVEELRRQLQELRQQLAASSSAAGVAAAAAPAAERAAEPAAEAAGSEDGAHQSHLELLRSVRDELLKIADGGHGELPEADEGADSPRHVQTRRRCRFLELQLEALLRHTQAVERLLDTRHDSHLGPSPDIRRRLSIQRVQQDGEALFNELSERLHTLEVQKADADQEVQRLQARIAELRRELSATQQSREDLLHELGSVRHASVHDELRACLKVEDLAIGGEPSATSETRSVSSSGYLRGGDCGGFLTEASGTLQPSPKGACTPDVSKVVSAQFLASTTAGTPSRRTGSEPGVERHHKGHRRSAEDGRHNTERKHRGTSKKAEGDCEMQ